MNPSIEHNEVPKGTYNQIEYGVYKAEDGIQYKIVTPRGLSYYPTFEVAKKIFDRRMNKLI